MSEFKTVVESFQSSLTKVTEIVLDTRADVRSLKEQVGLLHEGQTELKNMLKQKADQSDLAKLEKRVTRLEHKVA